jgi:sec-independent protein translocase protein TatC
LPIVTYLLTKIGLFDSAFLKKYRRHAVVIILILSAIITPPDWVTQIIVSVPLLLLYEVGIFVAVRVEKNALKAKIT